MYGLLFQENGIPYVNKLACFYCFLYIICKLDFSKKLQHDFSAIQTGRDWLILWPIFVQIFEEKKTES